METPHYPETPAAHESGCVMSATGRLSVPLQYHIWPLGEMGLLFVGCWDRVHSFVLGRLSEFPAGHAIRNKALQLEF